jgi:hypothetical protein
LGHADPVRSPSFSKELRLAAAASQVEPRLVAERPEEWRLGTLTVVLARDSNAAQLRYARLAVARARGDADAIVAAWRRALTTLTTRSLAPDRFLPLLFDTYQALLKQASRPAGERIELTAVRDHVLGVRRGYTRAQFAWDLARLVRERRLVHTGWRIDLGVATGTATSRASRVVWVEDESGAGQYYQSFRMLPLEESHP